MYLRSFKNYYHTTEVINQPWWLMPIIPALRNLRQEVFCEFKVNLGQTKKKVIKKALYMHLYLVFIYFELSYSSVLTAITHYSSCLHVILLCEYTIMYPVLHLWTFVLFIGLFLKDWFLDKEIIDQRV